MTKRSGRHQIGILEFGIDIYDDHGQLISPFYALRQWAEDVESSIKSTREALRLMVDRQQEILKIIREMRESTRANRVLIDTLAAKVDKAGQPS